LSTACDHVCSTCSPYAILCCYLLGEEKMNLDTLEGADEQKTKEFLLTLKQSQLVEFCREYKIHVPVDQRKAHLLEHIMFKLFDFRKQREIIRDFKEI